MKAKFALLALVNGKIETVAEGAKAPKGATRFYVRYTDDQGYRVTKPIGADFKSAQADVKTLQARRNYEEETGQKLTPLAKVAEEIVRAIPKKKLAGEIAEWIELKSITPGVSKNTPELYRRGLKHFEAFAKERGILDSSAITKPEMFRYAAWLRDKGEYEPGTIYTYFVYAMLFLKGVGVKLGIPKKEWGKPDPRPAEKYTDEELTAIFRAGEPEESIIFKAFLMTGMRNQEMAHLTYRDINFKDSFWTVRAKKDWSPKSRGSVRHISVPPRFTEKIRLRMIQKCAKPTDLVFPNSLGTVHKNYGQLLDKVAERAGVTGRVDIHKFRATAATKWLRDGTDVVVVARQLGHGDLKTIWQYVELAKLESEEIKERSTRTFAPWLDDEEPGEVIPFRAAGD